MDLTKRDTRPRTTSRPSPCRITRTSPDLVPRFAGTPDSSKKGTISKTPNELLGRDQSVIAGKTGYTDDAGYCLVEIARRGDRTILAVILGSTTNAWYGDASNLLEFGFSVPITNGSETLWVALNRTR